VRRGLGCLSPSIYVPTTPRLGLPTKFIQPIELCFPSAPDPRGENQTYCPQEMFPQRVIYSQYIHPVLGYLARHQVETAHFEGAEAHYTQSLPPLLLRHFPPNPQSFFHRTHRWLPTRPLRSAQRGSTKRQHTCFKTLSNTEEHVLYGQSSALLLQREFLTQ